MKTYTFHISVPNTGRTWRKIEMKDSQTLNTLHLAIQKAFKFDNDHLYSFFMSGKAWDRRSEYSVPEDYYDFGAQEAKSAQTENTEPIDLEDPQQVLKLYFGDNDQAIAETRTRLGDRFDEWVQRIADSLRKPGNVHKTKLSSLDLQEGQQFLYLFDYGDEWHFHIKVHAVNGDAPKGKYPRIVESVGTPPSQYPEWDEGDDFIEIDMENR